MPFSPQALARLLEVHPRKRRIRRRLRSARWRTLRSRLPERSCQELRELCAEVEDLERGLVAFLERRIPSPTARVLLRARWRRVREANALQRSFVDDWERGGVIDAERIGRASDSIDLEARELRLFARDLLPRIRPRLQKRILAADGTARALDGVAIAVRRPSSQDTPIQLVYKPIACFDSRRAAAGYLELYRFYVRQLQETCGVSLPWSGDRLVRRAEGRFQVYVTQERLPEAWIVQKALWELPVAEGVRLVEALWEQVTRVWRANDARREARIHVAVDALPGHWALEGFDPNSPELPESPRLLYLATHRPLLLRRGRPLLDPWVVTQGAPWLLGQALAPRIEGSLARHHDLRAVLVKSRASCSRGGRADLQAALLERTNELIAGELGHWIDRPLTQEEVLDQKRSDARYSLLLRSFDRASDLLGALRSSRDRPLLDTALELYGILTRPHPS
ncbi:MAG: hypothetical protein ABFS46_09220 [Myxococcota bacterium]